MKYHFLIIHIYTVIGYKNWTLMGSGQKYSEEVQRIGQGLNIDVPTQPQYTPNAHLQETCFPEI